MKTKILLTAALMSLTVVLFAQPVDRDQPEDGNMHNQEQHPDMRMNDDQRGPGKGLNLTYEQKEAFRKGRIELQKQIQPLQNELEETEVHQKTLMTAEKTDIAAINQNIEKIGALHIQIDKLKAKHEIDMRAQLTEEQRMMFDQSKKHKTHEQKEMKPHHDTMGMLQAPDMEEEPLEELFDETHNF